MLKSFTTEFKAVGQATLDWQKVPMLMVGVPTVAARTVPLAVFQVLRGELPEGLAYAQHAARQTTVTASGQALAGTDAAKWPLKTPVLIVTSP